MSRKLRNNTLTLELVRESGDYGQREMTLNLAYDEKNRTLSINGEKFNRIRRR